MAIIKIIKASQFLKNNRELPIRKTVYFLGLPVWTKQYVDKDPVNGNRWMYSTGYKSLKPCEEVHETQDDKATGSSLIGQTLAAPHFFIIIEKEHSVRSLPHIYFSDPNTSIVLWFYFIVQSPG